MGTSRENRLSEREAEKRKKKRSRPLLPPARTRARSQKMETEHTADSFSHRNSSCLTTGTLSLALS